MRERTMIAPASRDTTTPLARPGYCEHAAARHIRVYLPYADANAIRLRAALVSGTGTAHVSWLYEVPGGWGWTICSDCESRARKSA
jgi:hypothetical protein